MFILAKRFVDPRMRRILKSAKYRSAWRIESASTNVKLRKYRL